MILALIGGVLIGLSAAAVLALQGRIAGVSGMLSQLVRPTEGERGWQAAFLAGLLVGGAVGVYFLAQRLILRRPKPALADAFMIPAPRPVDRQLILGAAIFGVGWGIVGFCPGPAVVSFATGAREALIFIPAVLLGMATFYGLRALARRAPPALNDASTSLPISQHR